MECFVIKSFLKIVYDKLSEYMIAYFTLLKIYFHKVLILILTVIFTIYYQSFLGFIFNEENIIASNQGKNGKIVFFCISLLLR